MIDTGVTPPIRKDKDSELLDLVDSVFYKLAEAAPGNKKAIYLLPVKARMLSNAVMGTVHAATSFPDEEETFEFAAKAVSLFEKCLDEIECLKGEKENALSE